MKLDRKRRFFKQQQIPTVITINAATTIPTTTDMTISIVEIVASLPTSNESLAGLKTVVTITSFGSAVGLTLLPG